MTTRTAPEVPSPRSRRLSRTPIRRWLFMRVSGAVLLVLVLAHLTANLVLGDGINAIDFALVAGRYANPFWQLWSLVMLWLAMLHGAQGLTNIIDDYAERPATRVTLRVALYGATFVIIALGTLVIYTFDPCPPTADPTALPSFCTTSP